MHLLGAVRFQFTRDGENTSPEFSWKEAPKETKAFAPVIHDPDAPRRDGFAHWVLYNIPPKIAIIEPNVPGRVEVKGLGVHGRNDSGEIDYTGPCPPSGTHRYFARLYALRDKLDLPAGATYCGNC
jgi:Raf kinase inhibitor-like YbhB/YbcL family protein